MSEGIEVVCSGDLALIAYIHVADGQTQNAPLLGR